MTETVRSPFPAVERTVVDIVNLIGPTSAPVQGFARYRMLHYPREQHYLVSSATVRPADLAGLEWADPDRFRIVDGESRPWKLARRIRRLIRGFQRDGMPVVVHLHHHRSALLFHLVRLSLSPRPPVVFTVRNAFSGYPLSGKLLAALNYLLASRVTFVSRASLLAFPEALRRLRPGTLHAVANGVDLERVDASLAAATARPSDADGGALRLLYVGRLVPQKNHALLVEALAGLPSRVTLTLVGQGPLRAEVERAVVRHGMEGRVRFTGLIPREAVYDEMARADVFVSTSRWEGMPVAVLEALGCRMPVLLSDIPPHREIAEAVPSVRLLPASVEAWRGAVDEWSSLPRAELVAIGNRNREGVEAKLSLERMHAEYTEIYRALLT